MIVEGSAPDLEVVEAAKDFCARHLGHPLVCDSVGFDAVTSDRVVRPQNSLQRLTLRSAEGEFEFYIRRQFVYSYWLMAETLGKMPNFRTPYIHVPSVLLVRGGAYVAAVIPAVHEGDALAQTLWSRLLTATEDERVVLAERAAALLIAFQGFRTTPTSIEEEVFDLRNVRHLSTQAVPDDAIQPLEEAIRQWGPLYMHGSGDMTPRDFSTNVLVGQPLFALAERLSLSLIDLGESYKAMTGCERLAHMMIACKFDSGLPREGKVQWLSQLAASCGAYGMDMSLLRMYLGLWGIRRRLWKSSGNPDLSGPMRLLREVAEASSTSAAVAECIELA